MKRVMSAVAATVVGLVWVVTFKVTPLEVEAVGREPTPTAPSSRGPTATATLPARSATPAPTAAPGAPASDGTFTGGSIYTIYGSVQVRVVVSGQKVVDVQALQLPRDRARSAFISQYSAPILRAEAIQAQTARIDIVSGATYTSIAYSRSLDSALQQAHRA